MRPRNPEAHLSCGSWLCPSSAAFDNCVEDTALYASTAMMTFMPRGHFICMACLPQKCK